MPRRTIRDLGYRPGCYRPGTRNSILDVAGLTVGQITLRDDDQHKLTGATIIFPRGPEQTREKPCYAAIHSLNGAGELTGSHFIAEWGFTNSPIAFTDSMSVGVVYQTLVQHAWDRSKDLDEDAEKGYAHFGFPVVGETWGGGTMDIYNSQLTPHDVLQAINTAGTTDVQEGSHGGGAPMLTLGFKAGTGTSSRLVPAVDHSDYAVGVLVQSNFGELSALQIGGVPIGKLLAKDMAVQERARGGRFGRPADGSEGSVLVLVVTDAPLLPHQLRRVAQRATYGIAAVSGHRASYHSSGDIFIALSTGNCPEVLMKEQWERPSKMEYATQVGNPWADHAGDGPSGSGVRRYVETQTVETVRHSGIDAIFVATAEATEEAILNSLMNAEALTGPDGTTWEALPHERVRDLLAQHKIEIRPDT